jgi:hypothetical protein
MPVLRRPVEPAGVDRKSPWSGQTEANDPTRTYWASMIAFRVALSCSAQMDLALSRHSDVKN